MTKRYVEASSVERAVERKLVGRDAPLLMVEKMSKSEARLNLETDAMRLVYSCQDLKRTIAMPFRTNTCYACSRIGNADGRVFPTTVDCTGVQLGADQPASKRRTI